MTTICARYAILTGKHGRVFEHPAGAHDAVDAGGVANLCRVGQGADVAVGQDGYSNRLKDKIEVNRE